MMFRKSCLRKLPTSQWYFGRTQISVGHSGMLDGKKSRWNVDRKSTSDVMIEEEAIGGMVRYDLLDFQILNQAP